MSDLGDQKRDAERDVKQWNEKYPPGTLVEFGEKGELTRARTTNAAEFYYSDSVVNIEKRPGYYSTSTLVPVKNGYAAHREWAQSGALIKANLEAGKRET